MFSIHLHTNAPRTRAALAKQLPPTTRRWGSGIGICGQRTSNGSFRHSSLQHVGVCKLVCSVSVTRCGVCTWAYYFRQESKPCKSGSATSKALASQIDDWRPDCAADIQEYNGLNSFIGQGSQKDQCNILFVKLVTVAVALAKPNAKCATLRTAALRLGLSTRKK